MKKWKFIALVGLVFIFIGIFVQRKETIITYANFFLSKFKFVDTIEETNEYYLDRNYTFVQNTDNYKPSNFQDILNIYYTVLNAGVENFTFRCDKSYVTCLKDVDTLANSQDILSDINNYVHPFNGFNHIETTYDNLGNVTISVVKSYTQERIKAINEAVDRIYAEVVDQNLGVDQNIKNIHDYIINNTKYDNMRKKGDSPYSSDTAYGALYEGYAVCGGYADTMAIFLNRLGVPNFKVSSEKHVWNAVYIYDKWLNLDLTWDDPVTLDGTNHLLYDFYLIDTETLQKIEVTEHFFNEVAYPELIKSN